MPVSVADLPPATIAYSVLIFELAIESLSDEVAIIPSQEHESVRQQLDATIEHLREQLAQVDDMNSEEAEELREALEEISATLDEKDVNSATLAERLQGQAEAFQESHPVLTQTVGRLADMLAQMGI